MLVLEPMLPQLTRQQNADEARANDEEANRKKSGHRGRVRNLRRRSHTDLPLFERREERR